MATKIDYLGHENQCHPKMITRSSEDRTDEIETGFIESRR